MTKSCLILVTLLLVIGSTISNPTKSTQHSKHSNGTYHSHHSKLPKNVTKKSNSNATGLLEEDDGIPDKGWEYENTTLVDTRRILYSKIVKGAARPYMVYLQLTKESAKAHKYRGWLCGGVIVNKFYVLTSAACVEDADRFYIVSGTTKFVDSFDYKKNDCVCRNRRKVVWKCIPKNYKFDFQDSIKWSSNDIAIVKVDKAFKLGTCEKGCEFATDVIGINNISRELEKPGTKGYIAGWGSGNNFREGVYRRQKNGAHAPKNAKSLQEAKVCIMDNEHCAKKWAQKFRTIITQYMICTKDVMKRLSEICDKKYANCTDVESGTHLELAGSSEKNINIDLGRHLRDPEDFTARRSSTLGGFCENDHGGPLIVKYRGKERVIGVISACKIDPKSHSCHGPFLYTSVFKNRQFISCAITKDVEEENCRRVFRTGITHEEWSVDWEKYKEDEEDDNARATVDKDSDKDSDSDNEKPALRKLSPELKKELEPKASLTLTEEKKKKASSSSSSESEESTDKSKNKKPEEEKDVKIEIDEKDEKVEKEKDKQDQEDTKKVEKSKKSKKKSKKSSKKKHAAKDEVKTLEDKKSKEKGDLKEDATTDVKGKDKREVFYESSRDENVNDPEE